MMSDKRSKLVTCYQVKYGNNDARELTCDCSNRRQISGNYNDERVLQRLQKESEDELEKARKMLKNTEKVVKQSRKGCHDPAHKTMKKTPSKPSVAVPHVFCTLAPVNESREAIRRLAKVAMGKSCDCSDGRSSGRSVRQSPAQTQPIYCEPKSHEEEKDSKELPKKPKLTTEQLSELLDQEARDVESAWFLTTEAKESYKKPCPKQQKAREAVRALIEQKKEEEPAPCPPAVPKEPLPFFDPDPDDISPEIAANMMYTQERGIKMISCPEETVRHLFADQLGQEDKEKNPGGGGDELLDSDLDETADADDSAFTRNMSQRESGSKKFDTTSSLNDKKTEFVLQEKEAKCVNRVQLRGNCAPWFPGYFAAFPDKVGESSIQVAKSPSGIFQKAWMAAKPNSMPPTDLYLVE